MVFRTLILSVSRSTTNCACRVILLAPRNAFGEIDVLGGDQCRALWHMAVYSLGNGHLPLRAAFFESFLQVGGNMLQNYPEWNLVEAAFGWPLLLIRTSGCNQSDETVVAIAMADNFDNVFLGKVIEARNAFPK